MSKNNSENTLIKPTIYYCYDAYCGWCYGFSKVMTELAKEYSHKVVFDVLSGGMIDDEAPQHIGAMAPFISEAHKNVEKLSGVKFGEEFLWHINNPGESDWHPESTTPAIALSIFKDYVPEQAVFVAADLQYALNYEGRDLTDKEAYRHLLPKYGVPEDEFFGKLKDDEYREKAYYDFALVKQLQVKGFPAVLMQVTDSKFYLLAQGYTPYETMKERIEKVMADVGL